MTGLRRLPGGLTRRLAVAFRGATRPRPLGRPAASLAAWPLAALLAAGCIAPAPRPNVILVVIDTLRADHLGCYGYHRATSPAIDRLAARGVVFEQASATASYTRASTASIFTGQFPAVHGAVTNQDPISPAVPMLAESLSAAGYRTTGYVISANVLDKFGFGRGFDEYLWAMGPKNPRKRDFKARYPDRVYIDDDAVVTERALEFLDSLEGPDPFYLYLHMVSPHDPYAPPADVVSFLNEPLLPELEPFYDQEWGAKGEERVLVRLGRGIDPLTPEALSQVIALYDGEIAYSDRQIGAILDRLEATGLDERTVVIVTSDHGEEFLEHGGLGHGESNYEEMLRVPLVVAGPGIRHDRVEEPVSLVDLMPTILELARAEAPAGLAGASLAPRLTRGRRESEPRPVYAESLLRVHGNGDPQFYRSLRRGDLKLVLDFERHRKALFDLAADGAEQSDLMAERPEEARALMGDLLRRHADNLASEYLRPSRPVDVPPELEERLRALGYVGGARDSAATDDLLRRPLRRPDLRPLGFLGHERELDGLGSEVDFEAGAWQPQQLLYGWGREGHERIMKARAGARLRRGSGTGWRIEGRPVRTMLPHGPLRLDIRIDGGEPLARRLERPGAFVIEGRLPEDSGEFVRFDLGCVPDRWRGSLRTLSTAACLQVDRLIVR